MPPDSLFLPVQHVRCDRPGLLPAPGALRLGPVSLPPGRPVVARDRDGTSLGSVLWATDASFPAVDRAWAAAAAQFSSTGLWPLLLRGLPDGSGRPWATGEFSPVTEADIDVIDAETVLRGGWSGWLVPIRNPWPPGAGPLAPFGPEFPGLAPRLDLTGEEWTADPGGSAHLGLVGCRRPVDALGLMGWQGPLNYRQPAEVSSVLRSWEDRFGVVPMAVGWATLTLLVTRPPTTRTDALRVAAEVAAFCPDALWQPESLPPFAQRDCTVEALATQLLEQPIWRLWWD